MECPHLIDNCKINCDFIKMKKCQLIDSRCNTNDVVIIPVGGGGDSSSGGGSGSNGLQKIWKCTDCESTKNNWICLKCGAVLCGRYEKAHALNHFNKLDHKICMNTLNYSVYCYKCDDFVVNETNEIEEIRNYIKLEDDSSSETSSTTTTIEETSSTLTSSTATSSSSSRSRSINSHSQETASISSNDSGWEEPRQIVSGRKLRPRKRTNSNDSSIENNSVSKRKNPRKSKGGGGGSGGKKDFKVVGLRNLGNTCFMNSVLQSLSNIQEFSCYFSALPSLEQQQSTNNNNKQKTQQRVYHSRSLKENLNDANVVEELRKVLINLSKGGDNQHKAISPECLFLVIWKVVPQFRGHRQHDAHEFLRYMLDRLHTELQHLSIDPLLLNSSTTTTSLSNSTIITNNNKSNNIGKLNTSSSLPINSLLDNNNCSSNNNGNGGGIYTYKGGKSSIVTNVFGGILQSEVRCLICGMESKKHDPFLDLSLDIPEKFFKDCSSSSSTTNNNNNNSNITATGGDNNNINKSSDTKPVCNIRDCLSSFTEVEELAETELYYCNSCKCKQKSTKRFWIRKLPNVLCLHIKRFRWNNFFRTKIDLRISFPINSLDMSQYVLNNGPETRRNSQLNNVYDLAAVIVHHGNGSSCGHYTSYAINNGTWLHFNDHTVKEVPPTAVADCKPYILFYIRRDISSSTASCASTSSTSIGNNNNSNLNKTL